MVQPSRAADHVLSTGELKKLSLEELLGVSVTLVSKRPEKFSTTPSAIQVITSEEIRRAGATHLADALRLAANVEVQQINSYAWVVSTRGFDALFSNKLLVMIDGRTVYTSLDAGVFWDAQGILLDDVDRIEVISGPGGALWGANAVNGVINIITRHSRDSQGLFVSGAGGSFLRGFGALRYGGSIGRATYRVYGQAFDRQGTESAAGEEQPNSWKMSRGGFRWDYASSETDEFRVQGDAYTGIEYTPGDRSTLDGENLLAAWKHTMASGSALDLRFYADRTWRHDTPSTVSNQMVTYDIDLQHDFAVGGRQRVLWGAGFRSMEDYTPSATPFVGFNPTRKMMQLGSAFVQDEIVLAPDRLTWTLGTKLESTEYSGLEVQPSTRLAWTPSPRHTVWTAVSRAVRAPSRIDVDYFIPKTPPYAIAGGPDFESETVEAYEFGYRIRPAERLFFSLATFYNHYDKLYSVELQNPPVLPYTIQNGVAGQSWGVELSGTLQPMPAWRLRGGYTFFRKDLWSRPGHDVLESVIASLGNDPHNTAVLQSMLSVGPHIECDVTARYVDRLPNPAVPSYVTFDTRLAVLVNHWELAVVGRNLSDDRHPEFYSVQEVPRSIHGSITTRW